MLGAIAGSHCWLSVLEHRTPNPWELGGCDGAGHYQSAMSFLPQCLFYHVIVMAIVIAGAVPPLCHQPPLVVS